VDITLPAFETKKSNNNLTLSTNNFRENSTSRSSRSKSPRGVSHQDINNNGGHNSLTFSNVNNSQNGNSIKTIDFQALTRDYSMNNSSMSALNTSKEFFNNVQFRFIEDKSQWKNSPNCQICMRKFVKVKLGQHHCRMCANSVCDFCSKKRQKGNRVCDYCDYNLTHINEMIMQTLARNKQKEELGVLD